MCSSCWPALAQWQTNVEMLTGYTLQFLVFEICSCMYWLIPSSCTSIPIASPYACCYNNVKWHRLSNVWCPYVVMVLTFTSILVAWIIQPLWKRFTVLDKHLFMWNQWKIFKKTDFLPSYNPLKIPCSFWWNWEPGDHLSPHVVSLCHQGVPMSSKS